MAVSDMAILVVKRGRRSARKWREAGALCTCTRGTASAVFVQREGDVGRGQVHPPRPA
eukprot:CAMPEP_0183352144 /NCGR_PEP_ID=MMETSP0164_2-20130417/27809_1 /TAXON_ID=221442 /ORGANISM="Coccolithus pelagicus ssp braarudi, Strain PLY182g" /LENGTH=57 /DNA_ID=CAMNT_0025524507 /DNA_START=846 /DNA_END=1016 /DNA_ORIENTATION=+